MDYVGNQRSPLWDDMEAMEDENEKIGEELPTFETELAGLKKQLAEAQRKTRMIECYKLADPEATGALSTKAVVQKLSGFAKFDIDLKLTQDQWCQMVGICSAGEGSEDKFGEIMDVLEKTFKDGETPYAGDLENETYKGILTAIRDLAT